jgi:hypothetical protein
MDNGEEYLHLCIPKVHLKKGNYYSGLSHHAYIARWDGKKFIHWRTKFGKTFLEDIDYWEMNGIYDGFLPLFNIGPELPKEIQIHD